jgi:tyrosine-protein kinase Etk/Wzc
MLQFHLETASHNIICLIGATPKIGKSFISTNLAYVLHELNKRVLLIDADLRKGKIHHTIGVKKIPGFSELLIGKCTESSVIKKVFNNLDFIPCGEYPANPAELLASENTNRLLDELSKHYDYVIIDTPPVLAVTDGIVVARKSATNLLVVGGGTNVMEELELTVKRATKNGVEIHGLVFNHVTPMKHSRVNYNYYYALQEE